MKVIVAGSRSFEDYSILKKVLDEELVSTDIIISGGAKGADTLAYNYAKNNKLQKIIFNADWKVHGKKAGIMRNFEMANEGERLIAFWDGYSNGTKHMIQAAHQVGIPVRIVKVDATW